MGACWRPSKRGYPKIGNLLKKGLSAYFAKRAEEEMDKLWDEGLWDQEKNEQLLHEHLRIPYDE